MATSTPTPTSSTAKELLSIAQILHLTHHRNNNQHRLSKWYKSLSTLRRQVQKVLHEVQELDTARTFSSSKKGSESRYVQEAREKVEARVQFWEGRLMETWFLSFTNLTADNQYATLGLMLLGCLAKVRMVVRPFGNQIAVDESSAETKVDESLEVMDRNDLGEVIKREARQIQAARKDESDDGEKTLEPVLATVKTKKITLGDEPIKKRKVTMGAEAPQMKKTTSASFTKRPKKKRKKGDAFDDMFSGLV